MNVYFVDDFGSRTFVKDFDTEAERQEFVLRKNRALEDHGLEHLGYYMSGDR